MGTQILCIKGDINTKQLLSIMNDKVYYWIEMAEYDLETAIAVLEIHIVF